MRLSTEAKVGIFFFVGLVILAVITFKVEDLGDIFQRKVTMYAKFPHAAGMSVANAVAVAGLRVGEVSEIRLAEDGVVMVLSISADTPIRKDSTAAIAWGGLLGNRYIDITLGSQDAPLLPPKSYIPTVPAMELTAIFAKIDAAATQLQSLLGAEGPGSKVSTLVENLTAISDDIRNQRGTVGKLIASDELYAKINGIADDLKEASGRISRLVETNDKRISSIIENIEAATPEAREAFASIRRIGEEFEKGKGILPALLRDEKMVEDLRSSLSRLNSSLEKVEMAVKDFQEGKGLLGRLTTDEQLGKDFTQLIESLGAVAKRLETGDNTLARLTRDEDLYLDVKKLLDDARETLRSAREQVPVGTFAGFLLSAF